MCMYNVGIDVFDSGDTRTAARWFQRAAKAGHVEGFAALTQMADNAGDKAGELYWARLGAEAGQTFCMSQHGLHLVLDADQDIPTLRRAREFLEQAADRGDVNAMGMAANVNKNAERPCARPAIRLSCRPERKHRGDRPFAPLRIVVAAQLRSR